MGKIEEILKDISDKIERYNGVKAYLNSEYYSKTYCELREISAWKFGSMLANTGRYAIIEMLEILKHIIINDNSLSPEEIVKMLGLVRSDLCEKAKETEKTDVN